MPKLRCKPCLATGLFALAMLALVTPLSLSAVAQNLPAPPPSAPPATSSTGPTSNSNSASSSDAQSQDQSVETLKVNVEVVQLFFNVKDKHGALIPSLTKDNFEIYEDGKPQTVKYFKAETDLPLTLGILIDASGSQQHVLPIEQEVGGSFLESTLRPRDMASVFSFDVDVNLLQDFTGSVSR